MNASETIETWRWRIIKAGYKSKDFAALLDIDGSLLSAYCKGRVKPSLERFDLIENKLKSLGV